MPCEIIESLKNSFQKLKKNNDNLSRKILFMLDQHLYSALEE